MKTKNLFVILLFVIITSSYAQEIYFCNSHTENGDPVDAKNVWAIKPWGSLIYILFNNDGEVFDTQLNYMFIDRYVEGNYRPFDSKAINVKEDATWFAYSYKFIEPGKYRVYFINQNKKELGSEAVTIQLESDYLSSIQGSSSLYYDGARVKFCERVIAGKPINEFKTTSLSKNEGFVRVYVKHNSPLKTNRFLVDIWQKGNDTLDYNKFVESKKYALSSDWNHSFFTYQFTERGEYKFNIYNQNEILISSGYITVKE